MISSKNNLEVVKMVHSSKVETIGNANLLATTVSDIGLWPSINYMTNIKAVANIKMATVMCGTIKVIYKVTGW